MAATKKVIDDVFRQIETDFLRMYMNFLAKSTKTVFKKLWTVSTVYIWEIAMSCLGQMKIIESAVHSFTEVTGGEMEQAKRI